MDDDIIKIPRRAYQQFRKDPEKMLALLDIAAGEYPFTIRSLAAEWGWKFSKAQRFMETARQLLETDTPTDTKSIRPIGPEGGSQEGKRYKTDTPTDTPLKKKRTAPPKEMEVTEGMRDWFRDKFGTVSAAEVQSETEKFLDFHRARGSLMKDWAAAWRTWMRNWRTQFGQVSGNAGQLPIGRGKPSKADSRRARLDGMLNEKPKEDDVPY